MHFDPILLEIFGATLAILLIALVMRTLEQPHVVAYLTAGIVLGPHGLAVITEQATLARLGELGVVLLLFFVGMETHPRQLVARWRVTVVGTFVQICGSVALFAGVGWLLDWPGKLIVLLGFVISLSSTAVVLNYLQDRGELKTRLGEDALGILLAQDLAVIPMLLIVAMLGGEGGFAPTSAGLQLLGAVLAAALFLWMVRAGPVRLPLGARLRADHELQLFFAAALCLGFALLSGLFGLSTALGAFLAGMLVGVARETNWVHHRLDSFRVLFVALFFLSVGLLVNVDFVIDNAVLVGALVLAVFVGNTLINGAIFRVLGEPWSYALRAGAYLAQIGEFSFVLAAVGARSGLLDEEPYQLTIAVIALTLLLSPAWIGTVSAAQRRFMPVAESKKA